MLIQARNPDQFTLRRIGTPVRIIFVAPNGTHRIIILAFRNERVCNVDFIEYRFGLLLMWNNCFPPCDCNRLIPFTALRDASRSRAQPSEPERANAAHASISSRRFWKRSPRR